MILFYSNTVSGALIATVIKQLCNKNNIPLIGVGCNDSRSASLSVMSTLLSVGRPSRKDVVFVNLPPNVAVEQFLSDQNEGIRSVTSIGTELYTVKTRLFYRLTQSGVISLFNVSGADTSLSQQLTAIFSDQQDIRHTLLRAGDWAAADPYVVSVNYANPDEAVADVLRLLPENIWDDYRQGGGVQVTENERFMGLTPLEVKVPKHILDQIKHEADNLSIPLDNHVAAILKKYLLEGILGP